jgi:hypothetical protein
MTDDERQVAIMNEAKLLLDAFGWEHPGDTKWSVVAEQILIRHGKIAPRKTRGEMETERVANLYMNHRIGWDGLCACFVSAIDAAYELGKRDGGAK